MLKPGDRFGNYTVVKLFGKGGNMKRRIGGGWESSE